MREQLPETQTKLGFELSTLLKTTTTISTLKRYVDRIIIPQMNMARGRMKPMSRSEVVSKLFSLDPDKPGETMELTTALYQEKKGFRRDPVEIALEVADIIYYTRQPEAPPYLQNPTPLFEGLQLTYDEALVFCCLKYSTRLRYSGTTNTKQEEYQIMKRYLEERGPRRFVAHHLR